MQIIPKYQSGGYIDMFTSYDSMYSNKRSYSDETNTKTSKKSSDSSDSSEKGQLTEKDFFSMLEKVNALPNERRAIISQLMDVFSESSLLERDTSDIKILYLQTLDQISQASINKNIYDEAVKSVQTNDAGGDVAISQSGKLVTLNNKGDLGYISLEEYYDDPESYTLISNSDLANFRRNSSSFINDQQAFDILQNAMSYKIFQQLVDQAKNSLGTMEYNREGLFASQNNKIVQGQKLLESLKENDQVQALGSVTANGLYEYDVIDKNQLQQIKAFTQYITTLLPERAKTWASLKSGNPDKNKAISDLVETYLISGQNITHDFNIDYKGSMEKVTGKESKESKQEDPKMGFWAQIQADTVGEDSQFLISPDNSYISVKGKYVGSTPGLDSDKSLQEYLIDSGLGSMRTSKETITFGDVILSEESFKNIVVNSSSGAFNVILPKNQDGTVNLHLAKLYTQIVEKLEQQGYKKGTSEYNLKQKQLFEDYPELSLLINPDGSINASKFGQFLVLEGIANSNTVGKNINNKTFTSLDEVQSDFIQNRGDDDNLKDITISALSSKEKGQYEIDEFSYFNPFDWSSNWYTNFYTGMIYIPITSNRNTASLADENVQKESTVYDYEQAYQNLKKLNNLKDTNSK